MLKEGDKVPGVTFRTREDGNWKAVTTDEIFGNKRVVVFSLPGAFTPTCSSTHLPGFLEKNAEVRAQGVDDIYCLSVNDSFVMNAWAKEQGVDDEVKMIPDGNGEFSDKMGQLVDKADLGFGKRSWRYAMVVNDGTIEKMFVEPEKPGDPFEVSDVDTVLGYLKEAKEKAA
ncbi:peroxiredoxin [Marivibrio halodurans]|uniref:Glutathione-dependent peroxiredoxin n=1 Tax=Marivibrio halodurans TaxID=2039722 RepID=A0A8J7RY85_9PROT|nr:peroxiredoxin [Marivibrio halodurans]MBP5856585.1 peroxiredoxin [Marivibrio halodurans]